MEFSFVRHARARRDPELIPACQSGTRQQNAQRTPQRRGARPSVTPFSRVAHRPGGSSNTTRVGSPILPCSVCFNDMHPKRGLHLSSLPCGHAFCTSCIKKWVNVKSCCPTCMKRFEGYEMKPLYL